MAMDHQLHQPCKKAVPNNRLSREPEGIEGSLYPLAGLIRARLALVAAIALACGVGCTSTARVAVVNSEPQKPAPRFETSQAGAALDDHAGQMAEEDQCRAEQAYQHVPRRSRRFREEPIRSTPRP
ncbi:MAG: hypothetical protein IH987_09440 [Planctomycetes bacterium]|nr:hypothetical protein [Planctomycetota bacterium]